MVATDEESETDALDETTTTPEVIKNLRRTARRHFTDERKAITALTENEGDLAVLTVRRDNLRRLYNDCVSLQNRYIAKIDEANEQAIAVERLWCEKLSKDLEDTLELADGYKLAKEAELRHRLDESLEEARRNLQKITTPSKEKPAANPLHASTPKPDALAQLKEKEAAAITLAIKDKRRRLQDDLELSRITEERKRTKLKQKALMEEQELKAQLAAAGGTYKTPPAAKPGDKRVHDGTGIPGIIAITATNTKKAADSWIFEEFLPVTMDATTSAAMLYMAGAAKTNIAPFKGDPKQWPMFIQNFKATVHDVFPTDAQRICHLRGMLHADLQTAFAQLLSSPLTYKQALQDLWKRFGRPQLVVAQYISDLRSIQSLRDTDAAAIDSFQQKIHGTIAALDAAGYGHELHSSVALADLVTKLPYSMAARWGREVHKMCTTNGGFYAANIHDLDKWLESEVMGAKYAALPTNSNRSSYVTSSLTKTSFYPKQTRIATVNSISTSHDSSRKEAEATAGCPICAQSPGHSPILCSKFMGMLPEDRLKTLRDLKNCFRCLGRNHQQEDCKKAHLFCSTAGCRGTHHSLLHDAFISSTRGSRGSQ